ncbi:hypothetical protein JTB14_005421 [Gonioctena quinquepunctata]|nr:hypothetical protein JTB14_005421 [Gonioctena quinquepunctata]
MEVCRRCGSVIIADNEKRYSSTSNLYEKETSSRWWCFFGSCGKERRDVSEAFEIATSENVPKNGIYERRRTIQFDLENHGGGSSAGKILKRPSSILKLSNIKQVIIIDIYEKNNNFKLNSHNQSSR